MLYLTPEQEAALEQRVVPLAPLVEMHLESGTLYMNTSGWDLEWDGQLWKGVGGVGSINAVDESPSELKGLQFQLSGVRRVHLNIALAENVQGRYVALRTAVFDHNTRIVMAPIEWAGHLDYMNTSETDGSITIDCSAEHYGIDLLRPSNLLMSDQDQQLAHPGDTILKDMVSTAEKKIIWPSAAYYQNR